MLLLEDLEHRRGVEVGHAGVRKDDADILLFEGSNCISERGRVDDLDPGSYRLRDQLTHHRVVVDEQDYFFADVKLTAIVGVWRRQSSRVAFRDAGGIGDDPGQFLDTPRFADKPEYLAVVDRTQDGLQVRIPGQQDAHRPRR